MRWRNPARTGFPTSTTSTAAPTTTSEPLPLSVQSTRSAQADWAHDSIAYLAQLGCCLQTTSSKNVVCQFLAEEPPLHIGLKRSLALNATVHWPLAHLRHVKHEAVHLRRYMILDLKKFTPGKDLQPGLLWIAEQIPGLVASRDMTEQLARGYWPSYNIPYFPEASIASPTLPSRHCLVQLSQCFTLPFVACSVSVLRGAALDPLSSTLASTVRNT